MPDEQSASEFLTGDASVATFTVIAPAVVSTAVLVEGAPTPPPTAVLVEGAPTPPPTEANPPDDPDKENVAAATSANTGLIVGLVMAVLFLFIVGGLGFYWWRVRGKQLRRRRIKPWMNDGPKPPSSSGADHRDDDGEDEDSSSRERRVLEVAHAERCLAHGGHKSRAHVVVSPTPPHDDEGKGVACITRSNTASTADVLRVLGYSSASPHASVPCILKKRPRIKTVCKLSIF